MRTLARAASSRDVTGEERDKRVAVFRIEADKRAGPPRLACRYNDSAGHRRFFLIGCTGAAIGKIAMIRAK